MLRIRLQRKGRKNLPAYRIVVAEHSSAVKTSALEILGSYLPDRMPKVFECDLERVRHWVKHGAQPSQSVARLLVDHGMPEMDKYVEKKTFKIKSKKEGTEPEAAPAASAAPKAEAVATPKEETPEVPAAPKQDASAEASAEAPAEAPVETPVEKTEGTA